MPKSKVALSPSEERDVFLLAKLQFAAGSAPRHFKRCSEVETADLDLEGFEVWRSGDMLLAQLTDGTPVLFFNKS
jgi:hypothetical protein